MDSNRPEDETPPSKAGEPCHEVVNDPTPGKRSGGLESDSEDGDGPPSRLWTAVTVVILTFMIVPVLFSVVPRLSAVSGYSKVFYDSWRTDRHRAAASSCLDCHLESGIRGVATYPFMFYGEALTAISGGRIKPPVSALPTDAACRRSGCHSLNRLESLSRQIRVNHRVHAEKGEVRCIKCHPGAGHDGAEGRFSQPPMKTCEECHKEEMSDCGFCHLARTVPVQ
jgi:hypothetical protein